MGTRRRLLIWTENYWIGGCDRFLVDLIGGLRQRPVEVLLAGNPHPEFDAWLTTRVPWVMPRTTIPVANLVSTPLHRLDGLRRGGAHAVAVTPVAEVDGASPGNPAAGDGKLLGAAIAAARYGQATVNFARLGRLMGELRPDVLLINNGGYPGGESCRIAAVAARRAQVGRIVHFVHNMAGSPAWPPRVEAALDRRVDRSADLWVTAAHRASARLHEARDIAESRIATIHYGIAAPAIVPAGGDAVLRAELGFGNGRPGLAVIANLEPRKGISVLIRALGQLRERGIALPTAIVGQGPIRAGLEREIDAAGLAGDVRLLGWREDVAAILAEADLLALPSLANECLPYVILEAMAQSLPVVATDVAGIPEMVADGETGRVVAPGNPSAFAAALAELVGDVRGAARMGANGRARVLERFAFSTMIERMCKALELA